MAMFTSSIKLWVLRDWIKKGYHLIWQTWGYLKVHFSHVFSLHPLESLHLLVSTIFFQIASTVTIDWDLRLSYLDTFRISYMHTVIYTDCQICVILLYLAFTSMPLPQNNYLAHISAPIVWSWYLWTSNNVWPNLLHKRLNYSVLPALHIKIFIL